MRQMQEIDQNIRRALWKIRVRMEMVQFVTYLLYGMIAGLIAGIVVLLLAFVIPVYASTRIAVFLFLGGSLLGCVWSLVRFPGIRRAACAADKAGMKERMQTALELSGEESDMAILAKKDALYRIHRADIKEMIRFRIPGYVWLTILFLAVSGISAALIPSPVKEEAQLRHELAVKKEKEKEKLEEAKKELEKQVEEGKIDSATAKELEALLEQSMKETNQAESASDIEKAENRLKTKISMAAADASKSGEQKKSDSLLTAASDAGLLSEQEAEQIKTTQLSQSSGQQGQSGDGNHGESTGISQGGESSSQSGEEGSQSGENGEGEEGNQSGEDGQNGQNGQSGQNGQNGQSGQGGQGGQNGTGSGKGNGNGNGSGNGNGNGSGNGSGSGSGNGTGWNTGSKNGVQTNQNLSQNPEQVAVGTQGSDGNLTGQSGTGSSKKQQSQDGLAWDGKKVSFDQVLSSYQQKAYSKISQNKVPAGMKGIVQSYFDGIGK